MFSAMSRVACAGSVAARAATTPRVMLVATRAMCASAGGYEHILVEKLPSKVAVIRLNRPKVRDLAFVLMPRDGAPGVVVCLPACPSPRAPARDTVTHHGRT